eukprot:TRINITY_DN9764_c0_g1_i3.p1 TRINITY_DN9764_c0_g1~~TRINITY_DN9764_c0_g1_i3.p1  ORF type:complete len:166 (-),score=46.34 TRINITY_DN9764_c0_g1_i3:53-550(-)
MCIRDRLGAPGTGKTCLIRRYCSGTFDEHAKPTMGFDFLRKRVTRQESTIEFQIWDTAGQDTFASLTRMYYKGTHGVLLVYDITSPTSFKKVLYWLGDLADNGSGLERILILGNKADLTLDRRVTQLQARTFTSERKLKWMECSARTGKGVEEACLLYTSPSPRD